MYNNNFQFYFQNNFDKTGIYGTIEYIYNEHYRRFIDKNDVVKSLKNLGLVVEYLAEDRGFSKNENSDPVLMRLVAVLPRNDEE